MTAVIRSFRRSLHRTQHNQLILVIDASNKPDDAKKLVGKSVVWTSEGKHKVQIKGKITGAHGNSGAVRAHFEKGLPGQALGTEVTVG